MVTVYLEDALKQHLEKAYTFRPKGVGYILIYNGKLTMEFGGSSVDYKSGEIILLSPANVYTLLHCTADLQIYIVSFDPKKLRQRINFNFNGYNSFRIVHANRSSRRLAVQLPEREFEHLKELSGQLWDYHGDDVQNNFHTEIITGLSSVAGFIIANELVKDLQQNDDRNVRKEEITLRFIELVSRYFKEEKELKFYADKLFISVKYLSNCVRDVTHLPPTRFLSEALVNEAKELLLNTDLPVYGIGEELRFSDQYAFGKFFKKHTGQSPLNFRKQNKQIHTI